MEPAMLLDQHLLRYAGYRLSDSIFWAFPLLALLICATHAARRAFRHPIPAVGGDDLSLPGQDEPSRCDDRNEQSGKKGILRYTWPQRLYHWVNASTCILLLFSGLAIYEPGSFSGSTPSSIWFALHRWFGVVLIVAALFHVIYDGYIKDSLGFLWFDREVRQVLGQIVRNFLGLSPVYPKYTKYHPMQMGTHWMMAGNLFVLTVTGFILWRPTRILLPVDLLGLGWDFIFLCRTLHDFFAATFLALILGHVYFAVAIKKNWIISRTMLTGRIDYDDYVRLHRIVGEISSQEGSGGEKAAG